MEIPALVREVKPILVCIRLMPLHMLWPARHEHLKVIVSTTG